MRAAVLSALALALIALGAPPPASAQDLPPKAEPARPACPPATEALPGAAAYEYRVGQGRTMRLFVFSPPGATRPSPAILFFFGGGWRTGDVRAFEGQARTLAAHGMIAALADYRVACRDNTSPAAAEADAESAYAYMRREHERLGVDPARIVLSGGSAGGHLALTAAMLASPAERPAALVLFNPVVDMMTIAPAFGLTPSAAARISPSLLPVRELPPMIIFHGQADHTVPIATVRAFCARVEGAGGRCELHEYQGKAHGFFNSRVVDPALGASPYDDTLAHALAFLQALRLAD
jgi:acetyl esterase/lipase